MQGAGRCVSTFFEKVPAINFWATVENLISRTDHEFICT
jgi:hypothetical protein